MSRIAKLNQTTLCADGSIGLQFLKIIADGDTIISNEPHRFVIQPDEWPSDAIPTIGPSLEQMGFTMITGDEIDHIDTLAAAHRAFPSVADGVAVYVQKKADAIAKAIADEAEAARVIAEAAEAKRVADEAAQAEQLRINEAEEAAAAIAAEERAVKAKADAEANEAHLKQLIADGVAAALAAKPEAVKK